MLFLIPNNSVTTLVMFQFSRLIWFLKVFHTSSWSFKVVYNYTVFLLQVKYLLSSASRWKLKIFLLGRGVHFCVPIPFGEILLVQFWSSAGKLLSKFCEISC